MHHLSIYLSIYLSFYLLSLYIIIIIFLSSLSITIIIYIQQNYIYICIYYMQQIILYIQLTFKITVFKCFQGVDKGCIGNEWVNNNKLCFYNVTFSFYVREFTDKSHFITKISDILNSSTWFSNNQKAWIKILSKIYYFLIT